MTDQAVRTVLFLCTGNYYRSRFAEHLFTHLGGELRWRARSRGLRLSSSNVGPMSAAAHRRLAELGVAVPEPLRSPAAVTEDDLAAADLVVAVDGAEHRPLVAERHPAWSTRVRYWDVPDVHEWAPERALARLEELVGALVAELRGRPPLTRPAGRGR